jgi:predicted DNA-binding protein YlxM (UPF0122 family)
MDENKFKKINKPAACTQPPWASVIPRDQRDDVLRQIKQECIQYYGYSFDECPKRLTCFTKQCMGRPLPWLSPTAKPYLEKLKQTHKFSNDELYLSNCDTCPIAKTCKSACAQVNDFMQRDKIKEPQIDYRDNIENIAEELEMPSDPMPLFSFQAKVPWDAISDKRKQTVRKYLYEQKDFLTVAKELGYHDQSRARYEFYAALTTLSEYSVMRKFIEEQGHELTEYSRNILNEVYFENKSITEVASSRAISKQAVQQSISRVVEKYKINWTVFVRKEGNKVIYHKSEVLK